ncbi:hypothetical protein [Cyclobacterium salsum]|uniref:hypothetical protein n=1 Tax=Cyclobacterium salsum TaxID=2666329 RepID=UPI0013908EBB|nr:hypothetical protein [Cyclobacterium salsum]
MKLPTATALMVLLFGFSCQESSLLLEIPSSYSGVDFQNTLLEDEFMKIEQFYSGAGVAVTDSISDGLNGPIFTNFYFLP